MDTQPKSDWRFAEVSDGDAIRFACRKLERYAERYDWAIKQDYIKGLAAVMDAVRHRQALVIDGYLVLICEVVPWYSNAKCLQEWLVMDLNMTGVIESVPLGLEAFARAHNFDMVITADSSPVNIVAGAYRGAAFKPLTSSFYKVL